MTDLMLIIDHDPDSLVVLRTVADHLGCDRVESESSASLKDILAVRRPTIAVLALDAPEADGFAAPAIAGAAGERRARRRRLPLRLPAPNCRIADCHRTSGSLVPPRARTRTRWIRI